MDRETLRAKILALQRNTEDAKLEAAGAQRRNEEYLQRSAQAEAENRQLKKQLIAVDKEAQEAETIKANLIRRIEAKIAEKAAAVENLEKERVRLAESERRLEIDSDKMEKLKRESAEKDGKMLDVVARMRELEENLEELAKVEAKINAKVEAKELDVNNLQNSIGLAKARWRVGEDELEDMSHREKNLLSQLDQESDIHQRTLRSISELKLELDETREKINDLEIQQGKLLQYANDFE